MQITNDLQTFLRIDTLVAPDTTTADRIAAFDDDNWQIIQAALNGIERFPDPAAVAPILDLLDRQDQLDVYGGPDEDPPIDSDNDDVRQTWRCRYRVKQAAVLALRAIGKDHSFGDLRDTVRDRLCAYATEMKDDYPVRAAACLALNHADMRDATEALKLASTDGEWCTATEAHEALKRFAQSE